MVGSTLFFSPMGFIGPSLADVSSGVIFSGTSTVPEDTAVSSAIGTFSVSGGIGTYVYTFASGGNPGSKFSIAANGLFLAGALDYSVTSSYALVIEANNGVDPILTLNLTVFVTAVTVPAVVSFNPLDNATGVSTGASLVVTFNRNVTFETVVSITLKKTSDDSTVQAFTAANIGGAISITGAVLTITPSSIFDDSTGYYVLIGATSIKAGPANYYAGIASKTTWNFTSGVTVSGRQYAVADFYLIAASARQWSATARGYVNE